MSTHLLSPDREIKTDEDKLTWYRCCGCDGWLHFFVEGTDGGVVHDPCPGCWWFEARNALEMIVAVRSRVGAPLN